MTVNNTALGPRDILVKMEKHTLPAWYRSFLDWVERTRHTHATLESLVDMPVNSSHTFLCLDRNVLDMSCEKLEAAYSPGARVNPSAVFSVGYYLTFTKTGQGITGFHTFAYSLATAGFPSDPHVSKDFDIEYAPNHWYPMTGGVLPAKDEQGCFQLLGTAKSWKEFSPGTRVGFRGPMIPLELIDLHPLEF